MNKHITVFSILLFSLFTIQCSEPKTSNYEDMTMSDLDVITAWEKSIFKQEAKFEIINAKYNESVTDYENGELSIYEMLGKVKVFESGLESIFLFYDSLKVPVGFPTETRKLMKDIKYHLYETYKMKGFAILMLYKYFDSGNAEFINDYDSYNKSSNEHRDYYFASQLLLTIEKEMIQSFIESRNQ